jgi:phage portal protein BeeE
VATLAQRALARRAVTWLDRPAWLDESFTFGGNTYYPTGTTSIGNTETISGDFAGLVDGAFKVNPVVFACELKRIQVFSEARFQFRRMQDGRPGDLFGTADLDVLETPWPRGTTSDLLARMITDADNAGNAYVARLAEEPDRLYRLRPDYVTIVMGSRSGRPVAAPWQLDAEIIGFIYDPRDGGQTDPVPLTVDEVAHFAPIPDPLARFRGMSWMQPAVGELGADRAATEHKAAFFTNGANPRVIVSFDKDIKQESIEKFAAKMDAKHAGWRNAYKTLYLGGGATATVVGRDMQQLDFANVIGRSETRIAACSGIHPVLIPLSEGLQGSALNAGNYKAAQRSTADTTFRHLWRNVAGSLAPLVVVPTGADLWTDDRDIAFLREDARDRADVQFVKAQTIRQYVEAGFTPDSAAAAVEAEDPGLLVHTGMTSVQLQKPGQGQLEPSGNGNGRVPAELS